MGAAPSSQPWTRVLGGLAVLVGTTAGVLALGWGLSGQEVAVSGLPLGAAAALVCLALNGLAFLPASALQTDRFYDLTGSFSFISVVVLVLWQGGTSDSRLLIMSAMILIWTVRLGLLLARRVGRSGGDARFEQIKRSPLAFAQAWALQAAWAFVVSLPITVVAAQGPSSRPLGWPEAVGAVLWVIGFSIEAVADRQKTVFRADARNRGRFITTGLWGVSQHPNYLGEILLWTGVFLFGAGLYEGSQWLAVLSPVLTFALLTRVSGIPMLDALAQERWGSDPDYQDYIARTPKLWPRLSRS